jgi:hypothetical protein
MTHALPDAAPTPPANDWARQPMMVLWWWGLPIAIGMLANVPHLSQRQDAAVWAVLFAWMATGCVLNALRCHRVHCYISGPVLLLGAIFAALATTGVIEPGARTFSLVINGTLLLALLSFAPEFLWKRYAG